MFAASGASIAASLNDTPIADPLETHREAVAAASAEPAEAESAASAEAGRTEAGRTDTEQSKT